MRFGIDLDGVLGDFTSRVIEIGNQLWPGKFPANYIPEDWNYTGYLNIHEWEAIWHVIETSPYFWENETDLAGVKELKDAIIPSDEIFFVTARRKTIGESPSVQSARWLHDRTLWPRAGYSTLLQVNDAKYKKDLFRGLELNFMLDDYAPTVEQLNEIEGMHAYVLDQPWNRYAKDLPRVFSVTEYLNKIRTIG